MLDWMKCKEGSRRGERRDEMKTLRGELRSYICYIAPQCTQHRCTELRERSRDLRDHVEMCMCICAYVHVCACLRVCMFTCSLFACLPVCLYARLHCLTRDGLRACVDLWICGLWPVALWLCFSAGAHGTRCHGGPACHQSTGHSSAQPPYNLSSLLPPPSLSSQCPTTLNLSHPAPVPARSQPSVPPTPFLPIPAQENSPSMLEMLHRLSSLHPMNLSTSS